MVTRESHSKSVSEFQCVPLLTSKGLIVLKCWPDQGTDQFEVESNTERFSIREVAHREVCMSAPSDNQPRWSPSQWLLCPQLCHRAVQFSAALLASSSVQLLYYHWGDPSSHNPQAHRSRFLSFKIVIISRHYLVAIVLSSGDLYCPHKWSQCS